MSAPALTLFNIETELLQLMELRDEIANEVIVTTEGEADRAEQLRATDAAITEYLKREVFKVDNVCGFLRECDARAAVAKEEVKRITAKAKQWEDRAKRVKQCAAEALAITVDPADITKAGQNQILKRLNGRTSELKLCKSAASVQVTDMSLVPEKMQRQTVTMPIDHWRQICEFVETAAMKSGLDEFLQPCEVDAPQADKRAISTALKTGPVPGARLIEDSVHIRIT